MSKMLHTAALALLLGGLAAPVLAEDAKTAAPVGGNDPVVARVDGKEIKRSDVLREMSALGPQAAQMPLAALYPQVVERLITTKLVSDKGYAAKVQDTPEAKERLKRAEAQVVADVYMNQTIMPQITDDKVKARYDELSKKFKPEDEVRARHILVPTETEAKDVIKQLQGGADFAKLAAEKSKDTGSMKEGGDLGYFPRAAMVKPFADAAFGMKVGELSAAPVKTDFGWHVIKVEDKRKSAPPPIEAVKAQIQQQLGNEMVGSTVKDMMAKAKIERFNIDGSPVAPRDATAKATPKDPADKKQ
jgi:peptidyl-prolyl cis-trans isomerase C